jgi:hypothetical protein
MDEAFLIRARHMLGEPRRAELDYELLVATLRSHQSSSAAARAAREERERREAAERTAGPLVELLVAGPAWREAVLIQRGCFNSPIMMQRVNAP